MTVAQQEWEQICDSMEKILEMAKFWSLRSRYASEEQAKVEGPHIKLQQHALWFHAKGIYCNNREAISSYVRSINMDRDNDFLRIMENVIDDEGSAAIEELLDQEGNS